MTAVVVSVLRFLTGEGSMDAVLRVVKQILIFWPIQGALIRFLGGARPYRSALAANSSSELIGLGFSLTALGVPWPGLVASFFLSSGFEGLSFTALGTAAPKTSFSMAAYVNFFVHLLMAGIFLCWPEVLSVPAGVATAGGGDDHPAIVCGVHSSHIRRFARHAAS